MLAESPVKRGSLGAGAPRACGKLKLDELFVCWLSLPETRLSLERVLSDVSRGGSLQDSLATLQQALGGSAMGLSTGAQGDVSSTAAHPHVPHTPAQQQQHQHQQSAVLVNGVAHPPHIQVLNVRKSDTVGGPAPPRSPTGAARSPTSPSRVSVGSRLSDGNSYNNSNNSNNNGGHNNPLSAESLARVAGEDDPQRAAAVSSASSLSSSGDQQQQGGGGPGELTAAQRERLRSAGDAVPQFYFGPGGRPVAPAERAAAEGAAAVPFAAAGKSGLDVEAFMAVTRDVCGLPSFFNARLFERCGGSAGGKVSKAQFMEYWARNVLGKSDAEKMFHALADPAHPRYLVKEDFECILDEIVRSHPGLEFLEATPEFQDKYKETVIIRIFYTVNKSGSGRLTLGDMKASDFAEVTKMLDEEPDINKVTRYYSYEAFYVLYCKMWELDGDHDNLLDKEDLLRYANYSLTFRAVDRIFGGYGRALTGPDGKMSYCDFCHFLLSEEDKNSDAAIRYYFGLIDLDQDGVIDVREMRYFYQEQLHRMECISQEVVAFEDVLCQLHDLVKPQVEGQFTIRDLKRCEEAEVFFNTLVSLNKFIAFEQRDPFQMRQEKQLGMTPFERFVRTEYDQMALEDEGGDEGDDGQWGDYDAAMEAPF